MLEEVTGGLVSFEDGVKASEEYAPAKKARVELRFDMATAQGAGAQSILDIVAAAAMEKVYEMLGAKPAARKKPLAAATEALKTAAPAAVVAGATAAKSTKTDKDKLAEAAGVQTALAPAADPAGMDDFTVGGADALDDDLTTVQPDPVSDADLNKAVQEKNKEIQQPQLIRGLIAQFNPDPKKQFTLAELPQEKRPLFLAKLKDLKKAA